jgi:nucleotide-binding universal stress UspA family protein
MGTRGRSGIHRFLLGSVAEKVIRTVDAPVMTVRPGLDAEA